MKKDRGSLFRKGIVLVGLLNLSIALAKINSVDIAWIDVKSQTQLSSISYANAVKRASSSVVNIFTHSTSTQTDLDLVHRSSDPLQNEKRFTLGSGVIIDENGYILTNFHVVREARQILVALNDGRKIRAKLVGSDPETDLAVIRIQADRLQPIPIGNVEKVEIGDIVLAIGNPFGLGQTVTHGIVSALGRTTVGINQLENYIQTDAAINPGNSGGALINTQGEIIGISAGIYSSSGGHQGIGFAIPINIAQNIMDQIIEHGHVTRGWLGVAVQTIKDSIVKRYKTDHQTGVLVEDVILKSPAAIAGIKKNDIVLFVNHQRIYDAQGFLNYIAQIKPGSDLILKIWRDHREQEIKVQVGVRPRWLWNSKNS